MSCSLRGICVIGHLVGCRLDVSTPTPTGAVGIPSSMVLARVHRRVAVVRMRHYLVCHMFLLSEEAPESNKRSQHQGYLAHDKGFSHQQGDRFES